MKNKILEHTEKLSYIRQILKSCRNKDILMFYTPDDEIFAGQFHIFNKFLSILLLTDKNRQLIYDNMPRIREAVYNSICAEGYVMIMADESANDLLDWYRKEISYYTVFERTFKLSDTLTCTDCIAMFENHKTPWKGMYLTDNIVLRQYNHNICPDCGKSFYFPQKLLLATSDKYDSLFQRSFLPLSDRFAQSVTQIKQNPSVVLPVHMFDDAMFMQLRADLRRGIEPDCVANPCNKIAQPIITDQFESSISFVCPHCMSNVGSIFRKRHTVSVINADPFQQKPDLIEACQINLSPEFIRTVLGPQIYKNTTSQTKK